MYSLDIAALLGYTNNAHMMMETFCSSSNVILTDNPEYTLTMFQNTFKLFCIQGGTIAPTDGSDYISVAVYNLFKNMADKAIKYDRYKSNWEYLMGLYIAHNLALYLKANNGDPGATAALQSSLPTGLATSKSVDGLSISYDFVGMNDDYADYGTWKLTTFGQQLITLTKVFGHGGMWVNG